MQEPIYLDAVHPSELMGLYELLEQTKIPLASGFSGRAKKFGNHRAMVLGFCKPRFSNTYGLSINSLKHKELYEEIVRIGKLCVPFEFETIHLNHNVVCPPHFDSGNIGDSVLLSLGDYEGCKLNIEGFGEFDTNCQPLLFNGSKFKHWNTPLESGNKYSLVFYNARQIRK